MKCVYYFLDTFDGDAQFIFGAYSSRVLYHSPSECCMFVPGTYDEMMKDYGL